MIETPEKTSLKTLTLTNIKTLAALEKLLATEASPKRDKKMRQLLKELEVVNDEAMRNGLNFSAQFIARAKTGRVRPAPPPSADQKSSNEHRALMKFHFDHIKGPIADAPAQAATVKWLLQHYDAEVLKKCYEHQLTESWRGRVSWHSVKSDIGKWLAHAERHGKANSESSFEFTPESRIS